jgi:hypothetical protein
MAQTPKKPSADATEGKRQLSIKVTDEMAKGTYANLGIVHNNESEFVFDFIFMEPQRRQGHVVSRVVANPRTVKRLLVGLNELMRIYEERFGKIETP